MHAFWIDTRHCPDFWMWLAIFEKPFPGLRPVGHIGLHKSRIEPTRRNALYILH